MQSVTILPGRDKTGKPEPFQGITLERGELCTIVGNTGSGKSRFIKDVEQLAHGDSVTRRRVLLDGVEIPAERRQSLSSHWWPTWGRICASCWTLGGRVPGPPCPVQGKETRRWRCWPWPMRSPRSLLPWARA